MKKVNIELFLWEGKFGPFKIKSHCEECDIEESILKNMMEEDFKGKNVKLTVKPWLDNWLYCLCKFSWHPPILIVNGKKFHQYSYNKPLFDRNLLKKRVFSLLQ